MDNLKIRLQKLREELRAIDDRELRFELLIEYADRFKDVPVDIAKRPFAPENKVPACESDAYAFAALDSSGRIRTYFAVENPQGISAKAMAVILQEIIDGAEPNEVGAVSDDLVNEIFGRTISMGKGQGLMGMIHLTKELCSKLASRV